MQTLDPSDLAPAARQGDAAQAAPCLRILFHPELARIGDELPLPARREVLLGRVTPDFEPRGAALAAGPRPLGDPYISREHLALRVTGRNEVELRPLPGVRMPVSYLEGGADAVPRPLLGPARVPMGTLLLFGDRVLLALDDGADAQSGGAMPGGALVGRSAAVRRLEAQISAVARFHEPVLILGETGCGKELVARAIHTQSGLQGRFVGLNTAGLDEGTAASELFGHVRGAYTGAAQDRAGVFEAARQGTLFLDEVGDMSPELQRKLLRVLETRRFARLGSHEERRVESRVVAATHRPLAQDIEAGAFRRDLFERLRALTVTVPTLRERLLDVPLLFAHFLSAVAADRPDVRWLLASAEPAAPTPVPLSHVLGLMRYPWPGNVRELRNHVTALAAHNLQGPPFRPGPELAVEPFAAQPAGRRRAAAVPLPDDEAVAGALRAAEGRVQDAAQALGLSRFQVYRWLAGQNKRPDDFVA